jgi:hypothetical protein
VPQSRQLLGLAFGYLTVIEDLHRSSRHGKRLWRCRCSCGSLVEVDTGALTSGNTKSCGCYNSQLTTLRNLKHGCSRRGRVSKEYMIWAAIIGRCQRRSYKRFRDYGGRGIKVCERWSSSFENFFEDMGECPEDKKSIGRVDNDGDYCPENCRWEDDIEQANNKRNTVFLSYGGRTQGISQWARELGCSQGALWQRKNTLGWSDEKIICTPVRTSASIQYLKKDRLGG